MFAHAHKNHNTEIERKRYKKLNRTEQEEKKVESKQ